MTEKPLKFCMVSTFYPPYNFGGDGMHIYRLSNALARRGHSVDVFYCEDAFLFLNGAPPNDQFRNQERVRLRPLKSIAGVISPLITQQTGIPFFKGDLKRALESEDYDVIHYHNISLIGIKALSYGSAVKLYTLHEHWLVCPMHVLWKFDREVCTTKSCFSCQIAGRRPPQVWRKTGMMDRMLGHVDRFIAPSRFTRDKHREMGLDIPITHLPHFLPAQDNDSISGGRAENERPYFLYVGRLERIKGVQNLIAAFSTLGEHDLVIAGDGPYRDQLEQMAEGRTNIRFLGKLGPEALAERYRSATAVLVPSICYETFGIILIEAFSHATPVIVNDLGALPEVVNDSNGGIVYGNQEELEGAVRKLAADPGLRSSLGENGHRAYEKYWTEEVHIRSYLEMIESARDLRTLTSKAETSVAVG